MVYQIEISEQQRARITAALKHYETISPVALEPENERYGHDCEFLLACFESLPEDAKDGPKDTLHGFCL